MKWVFCPQESLSPATLLITHVIRPLQLPLCLLLTGCSLTGLCLAVCTALSHSLPPAMLSAFLLSSLYLALSCYALSLVSSTILSCSPASLCLSSRSSLLSFLCSELVQGPLPIFSLFPIIKPFPWWSSHVGNLFTMPLCIHFCYWFSSPRAQTMIGNSLTISTQSYKIIIKACDYILE